jgi:hypothetical protein
VSLGEIQITFERLSRNELGILGSKAIRRTSTNYHKLGALVFYFRQYVSTFFLIHGMLRRMNVRMSNPKQIN